MSNDTTKNKAKLSYLTEKIVGDDYLEEHRIRAITRPSWLLRQKLRHNDQDPQWHGPDSLALTMIRLEVGEDEYHLIPALVDEEGCILDRAELAELVLMANSITYELSREDIEQYNLNQRERQFIQWVELNSGKHYGEVVDLAKKRAERKKQQEEKASKRAGYVYVLRGANHYKIGRAKNPLKRFETLKIQLPFPTELIAYWETGDSVLAEKAAHEAFADCRVNGEWFDFGKRNYARVTDDIEVVISRVGYCGPLNSRLGELR